MGSKHDQKWDRMHVSISIQISSISQKIFFSLGKLRFMVTVVFSLWLSGPKMDPEAGPKIVKNGDKKSTHWLRADFDFGVPFLVHFGTHFGAKVGQDAPKWTQ